MRWQLVARPWHVRCECGAAPLCPTCDCWLEDCRCPQPGQPRAYKYLRDAFGLLWARPWLPCEKRVQDKC